MPSTCTGFEKGPHGPGLMLHPFTFVIVIDGTAGASVNAVWANFNDVVPAAVSVKVLPTSLVAGAKSVLTKLPALSAFEDTMTSGWVSGSSCKTMTTLS